MPPSTNLASAHGQESPLLPADSELDFHDNFFPHNSSFGQHNSFAQGNHIDIPTRLNMTHPVISQQYTPHMPLSDMHMGPTISTPSPLGDLSISPRDNTLSEDMDPLLPPSTDHDTQWYGGDSSFTLPETSNQHDRSLDDGTGQAQYFPAAYAAPAGESSPHFPLDVVLPTFASLLDLYLPQVHSLVFLVDDTDAASWINEAIQELRHPFRE